MLDGMLAVRDMNRRFDMQIPEDGNYTTVAGFFLAQAGHLPGQGETLEHEGARFTVERMDGRRIRRIRFKPAEKTQPDAAHA
jgi:CBS domain containing-hemolysin-like protein